MSEHSSFQDPEQLPAPATMPPTAPRQTRIWPLATLTFIGFVLVAGGLFYLWQFPPAPYEIAETASDLRVVQQKLAAIDSRLGRIEQMPAPPTAADLGKISARIDALEARIADQTTFSSRLDVLSGRIESLSGRDQTAIDVNKQQIDKAAGQISVLEKTSGSIGGVTDRVGRLARIQAAALALAAGRPLGSLPNAPPALSRYADAPPPTEAQLRLAFPDVERAAVVANPTSTVSGPFIDRVLERAQDLVTVRQGNDVVVGNAASVAVTSARIALDAGDLPTAVNAIASLHPPAGTPAADWLKDAKGLVDARAALADMAAHV